MGSGSEALEIGLDFGEGGLAERVFFGVTKLLNWMVARPITVRGVLRNRFIACLQSVDNKLTVLKFYW